MCMQRLQDRREGETEKREKQRRNSKARHHCESVRWGERCCALLHSGGEDLKLRRMQHNAMCRRHNLGQHSVRTNGMNQMETNDMMHKQPRSNNGCEVYPARKITNICQQQCRFNKPEKEMTIARTSAEMDDTPENVKSSRFAESDI